MNGHEGPVLSGGAARRWRLRRRHPSSLVLGAWFDGEEAPGVADHLPGCDRCRRQIHDLRRIRAALRSEPVPAPLRRPRSALAARAVPVLAVVAVVVGLAGQVSLPDQLETARRHLPPALGGPSAGDPSEAADRPPAPTGDADTDVALPPSTGESQPGSGPAASGPALPGPTRPASPSGTTTTAAGPHPAGPPAPGQQAADPPAPTLTAPVRLGAVLPADDEAAEIALALQRAVEFANRSGGVGGRPVELRTAPAHDPGAVRTMATSVDAFVGGAAAPVPAGIPWVFPADPAVRGEDVVAAEASPFEVGARLAEDLDQRAVPGPVGAVVGDGPDGALADGVASQRRTVRVTAARDDSCRDQLRALRRRDVTVVVLAGGPDLVERCTVAAAFLAWRPPGGILVPPSAAYAHLERSPAAQGVRTVLGLPWPDSDTPGANRYRAAVPGRQSYRALVSFAAVELAVQVARNEGAVRAERLRSGSWRSDLFHLEGGHHRQRPVMVASLGRWFPQPTPRPAPPGESERPG
ncbi:MAG: hypothetical protein AB1679_32310 [Actinomycetota bacterium]